MACFSAKFRFIKNICSTTTSSSGRRNTAIEKPHLVFCERRSSDSSIVFQAVSLLGQTTRFDESKLKVILFGEEMEKHPEIIPRTYTLTHCDFTANLTLSISNAINTDQVHNTEASRSQMRGWYNKLQRDDVVAEWKKVREEMCLHVHCHVSGAHLLLDLAAELRYHIFTKELPLVLKAVLHGDSVLFYEHPELMDSSVWVYFHSNSKKYNRVECWGPLKDAAQGAGGAQLHGLPNTNEQVSNKWAIPKSIVHALVALLL